MAILKLKDLVSESKRKIPLFKNPKVITTANLLENFEGYKITEIKPGNIMNDKNVVLLSCIRTYLKKCIFADFYSYTNNDILTISSNEKILPKYLYYLIIANWKSLTSADKGTKMPRLEKKYFLNSFVNFEENITMQQKIIDIIEQNEKLFLKHSNCVRIDNLEHVQKDMKSLIDIIEPIEFLENKILKFKRKIISLLINIYIFYTGNKKNSFASLIKLQNHKYENQSQYFATNAVGELTMNYRKIINLASEIPSRANISPNENSFILSKLDGENKIFYFKQKPAEVFSTGFFHFKTSYQDFILGFLLSQEFKKQKNELSTGTTMMGINNATLENISLNEPKFQSKFFSEILFDLEKERIYLEKLKNNLINLLIK